MARGQAFLEDCQSLPEEPFGLLARAGSQADGTGDDQGPPDLRVVLSQRLPADLQALARQRLRAPEVASSP